MGRKVFELLGDEGDLKFAIGTFDPKTKELLAGRPLKKFKTKKGAERSLKKEMGI